MNSLCISSLVVQTKPTVLERVREWINTIPEAEVYSDHEECKMVIVLDTVDDQQAADKITELKNQSDILSTTLIYQYINS